jgi:hypothetical protein
MTKVEDNAEERRGEKRVTYTAVLGFEDYKGDDLACSPPKPNATGANLSLGGICFQSDKRPQSDKVMLFLPDGSRAIARVVDVTEEDKSLIYTNHCEVLRWLPNDATSL